jgi:DNA mismatch repair protein MutS
LLVKLKFMSKQTKIESKLPRQQLSYDKSKTTLTGSVYFECHDEYAAMYGEKTIVFAQIGKFYESYYDPVRGRGYKKLSELEPLLNVKFIKKNPMTGNSQFGFPVNSLMEKLEILTSNGYTIVIFDQQTSDGEAFDRICSGVYSPGTLLSDKQRLDANYIMSAYICEEAQLKGKPLFSIGVSLIDLSTGSSIIHEFYSDKDDENFGLDELLRMIQTFRPVEGIFYMKPVEYDEQTLKQIDAYLELERIRYKYFCVYHPNSTKPDHLKLWNKNLFKITHQNEYLSKIFELDSSQLTLNGGQSALEIMNLERKPFGTVSYIFALEYLANHNPNLLNNLSLPDIYLHSRHLILGNNATEQLNILDSKGLELYNKKIQSLFDIVDETSTPMGKRFLKENLLNPLSQESKQLIQQRYDLIEELINPNDSDDDKKLNLCQALNTELKKIQDVERLHRKMSMGSITFNDFAKLDAYYKNINKIISLTKKTKFANLLGPQIVKVFLKYQIDYEAEFQLDLLPDLEDNMKNPFQKGVVPELDDLQNKIDFISESWYAIRDYFNFLIESKAKKSKNKDVIESVNDATGCNFTLSNGNLIILKEALQKKKEHRIELASGEICLKESDLSYTVFKTKTRITLPTYAKETVKLMSYITDLKKLVKKSFVKSMVFKYKELKQMLKAVVKFVTDVDFLTSGAIVAQKYYYCKPQINSFEEGQKPSFIKASQLRHPIIERLCNETEFVPNNVDIGSVDSKNGILLFGHNSSGKSSYMKSIGVALILAQIGYYVPAESFVYEPYAALYARITGNDNIFKGLSSFALEMTELNSILIRTESQGPNTLVIGDEVCRGTEDTSGRSIVAATLVQLSKCDCSYIFSSHLHDIPDIPIVKSLENLRVYHLKVDYDTELDSLVFNRKLTPGSGPKVYGLIVAKYFIKKPKFMELAETIRQNFDGEKISIETTTTSNYNKDLVVRECAICSYQPTTDTDKELESHHINFQMNCNPDGKIKAKMHLHKNKLYNLVVLCRKCHVKVHKKEITVNGYKDTSNGPVLDYVVNADIENDEDLELEQKVEEIVAKRISIKKQTAKIPPKVSAKTKASKSKTRSKTAKPNKKVSKV